MKNFIRNSKLKNVFSFSSRKKKENFNAKISRSKGSFQLKSTKPNSYEFTKLTKLYRIHRERESEFVYQRQIQCVYNAIHIHSFKCTALSYTFIVNSNNRYIFAYRRFNQGENSSDKTVKVACARRKKERINSMFFNDTLSSCVTQPNNRA